MKRATAVTSKNRSRFRASLSGESGTPLEEISGKAEAIKALGWQEESRGDPLAVTFSKALPEGESDPETEPRGVMGDYWLDANAIKSLLASRSK